MIKRHKFQIYVTLDYYILKLIVNFGSNNLIPDRSNARIDYDADEDIDSYPIGNVGSGQSKLSKCYECLVCWLKLLLNPYLTKIMYYYIYFQEKEKIWSSPKTLAHPIANLAKPRIQELQVNGVFSNVTMLVHLDVFLPGVNASKDSIFF